jgi:hypothetical protein
VTSNPAVEWPSGEATACKAVHTGSIPVSTSVSLTRARLAQRESASLTRKRSLVQSQYRAPLFTEVNACFSVQPTPAQHSCCRRPIPRWTSPTERKPHDYTRLPAVRARSPMFAGKLGGSSPSGCGGNGPGHPHFDVDDAQRAHGCSADRARGGHGRFGRLGGWPRTGTPASAWLPRRPRTPRADGRRDAITAGAEAAAQPHALQSDERVPERSATATTTDLKLAIHLPSARMPRT